MAGKDMYIPCRTNSIPGGLNSHRVFSGQFPATNLSFRQLSVNNFSFPELSATNFSANNFSFPEISATNFSANNLSVPELSATNFSANNLSFPELSANNLSVPFPELSATNFSANNLSFPELSANNLSVHFPELSASNFSANNLSLPERSANNLSVHFPELSASLPELSANNLSVHFPELSATNFSANNLSFPELSATNFSANNLSFPELSAANQSVPDYSANNLGDVWDSGNNERGFNLAPDVLDLGINSNLAPNSDNTLEALTHISQSLPISPNEAIGVQNENNRSESVEILQIEEVMPVDSSAQKPIGENKGKRTGRTKIDIPLEDMLQYDTVKEAAFYLGVSESTVDRRIKEHTKKTWSKAKRSEVAGKRVCKKGRIQDKNSVLVKVAYEGTKRSFEMPLTSKLGQLHSLVESSLKLKGGTYDTQYFDGAEYVSMTCDANLHCFFAYAPRSPRSNSILLNLKSLG